MARPKDKLLQLGLDVEGLPQVEQECPTQSARTGGILMSQAFEDKSKQELKRLRENTAQNMKEDMRRLTNDETHTDLEITSGNIVVQAHRCIIKCRLKQWWQDIWLVERADSDESCKATMEMKGLSRKQIEDFVNHLYTVNDSASLMEEYIQFLPGYTGATSSDSNSNSAENDFIPACLEEKLSESCNLSTRSEETRHDELDERKERLNSKFCDEVTNETLPHEEDKSAFQDTVMGGSLCNTNVKEVENSLSETEVAFTDLCCQESREHDNLLKSQFTLVNDQEAGIAGEAAADFDKLLLQKEGDNSNIRIASETDHTLNEGHRSQETNEDNPLVLLDSSKIPFITPYTEENSPVKRTCLRDTVHPSQLAPLPYDTCSPLAADLLRMYLYGCDCDCCLSVDGCQFLVHKCVLSARSEYFAAMLGGQWSESKMDMIHLEGVSSQAVEQLLLFLYGGVLDLVRSCDLGELFSVADMYGVLALKDVLMFCVRKDFCHFFHKPCHGCISSAPDAISLCHTFALGDLEARCLKWLSRYFTRIWPTKKFASLPEGIHQLCVQNLVAQITKENVLDIIMDCDKLTTSLPRIKWTESILCLLTQLMDRAIEFTSTNFILVIRTREFLQWAKVASWKAAALEEIFKSVIASLAVDTACRVYQSLLDLNLQQSSSVSPDADVLGLLGSMIEGCKHFLRTHFPQVARCKQWEALPKSTQLTILENSHYVFLDTDKCQDVKPKTRPAPRVGQRLPPSSSVRNQTQLTSPATSTMRNTRVKAHNVKTSRTSQALRESKKTSEFTTSAQQNKAVRRSALPRAGQKAFINRETENEEMPSGKCGLSVNRTSRHTASISVGQEKLSSNRERLSTSDNVNNCRASLSQPNERCLDKRITTSIAEGSTQTGSQGYQPGASISVKPIEGTLLESEHSSSEQGIVANVEACNSEIGILYVADSSSHPNISSWDDGQEMNDPKMNRNSDDLEVTPQSSEVLENSDAISAASFTHVNHLAPVSGSDPACATALTELKITGTIDCGAGFDISRGLNENGEVASSTASCNMLDATSCAPEPQCEVKVIKVNRPLSIGFFIPED